MSALRVFAVLDPPAADDVRRRSERFSRFKLSSVHGLMDRAEMLSGKGDKNESETVWLAEGEAVSPLPMAFSSLDTLLLHPSLSCPPACVRHFFFVPQACGSEFESSGVRLY